MRPKEYLVTLGVGGDKIETASKGNEEAKKGDAATIAKDRRVDLVLLKANGGAMAAAPGPVPGPAPAPAP